MSFKAIFRLVAAFVSSVLLATAAQAALVGRDINGNAVAGSSNDAVFLYDSTLNVTWLRNANVNENNGDGGLMNWQTANSWATTLSIGVFTNGWRLPKMIDSGNAGCEFNSLAGGTDCGYSPLTTIGATVYSEFASLWYDTLSGNLPYCPSGNSDFSNCPQIGWGLNNVGDFQNFQGYNYWYGTEVFGLPEGDSAWSLGAQYGGQAVYTKDWKFYALALRDGDVLMNPNDVPEPGTILLTAAALAGMGLVRRKRASRGLHH